MKVNGRTVMEWISEGRVHSIMAALQSQQRALTTTETLIRNLADQLSKVRQAYADLQDERDRYAHAFEYLGKHFAAQGQTEKWLKVQARFSLKPI